VVERFSVSTLLISENPEQMFGIKVVRLCGENRLVTFFSLIKSALLMELYGLLHRLRCSRSGIL